MRLIDVRICITKPTAKSYKLFDMGDLDTMLMLCL
jgi:hypothetical protein